MEEENDVQYLIRENVELAIAAERERLRREVEGLRTIHQHNSIPNYIDNLHEGCSTCIHNHALNSVLSLLAEPTK